MSKREIVRNHVWGRIEQAWGQGNFEEAQDLNHFLNALDLMSDAEYDECYSDAVQIPEDEEIAR